MLPDTTSCGVRTGASTSKGNRIFGIGFFWCEC